MPKLTAFIFALCSLISAQITQQTVAAIVVAGNATTQEWIIIRELTFEPGDAYDESLLDLNRDRLYNLGIFEQVTVYPSYQSSDSVIIAVQVVETIRLLPLPLFYYRDDVGWSYGAGLTFLNFRGRNQRLMLSGTLGGEKTYMVSFSDPWFSGVRVSLGGLAARYFRDHPVYPFRSTITVFSASRGKWYLSKRLLFSAGLGITDHQQAATDGSMPGDIYSPEDPQHYKFIYTTFAAGYQGTDVWRDPTRGVKASLQLVPHWLLAHVPSGGSFSTINGALAGFKSIISGKRPLVLAGGLRLRTNWGDIPNYGQNYLGGYWVRGYHLVPARNVSKIADRLEGKNAIAAGMELRQTILKRSLYLAAEIGFSMIAFTDIGWAFDDLDALKGAQPVLGYGAGLRFFIPTIQALALDWGFNPYDSKQHVRFSLGQRF